MRVGVGAPTKATATSGLGNIVSAMTTESWLTTQADGRLAERIAQQWKWDEAGTTLRLTLRKDVRFHDGTLLTPRAAANIIEHSVSVKEYASFSTIQSVTPVGEDAVDLKLSEPNSFLLPDLSLVSVKLPGKEHVATGPFKVVKRDQQQVVLRAFPQYFRGRPSLDEILVSNYPTQRNAWAALLRGDIDMLYDVSREAVEFVRAETTIKTFSLDRPYYNVLVFNVRHPVLKDARVRRALNEAMDKDTLIRDGLSNRGKPADGPLWPEHWAYSAAQNPFRFDADAARLALESAGLKTRPSTNGRMPSRFSFTCLVFADDPRFERLAVLVQNQLADVGVDMKLEPVPLDAYVERIGKGDFDAFIFEMAGRTLSWVHEFWRSRENGLIDTGYRSADAVLDRIRLARNDDQIRAGVAELARILREDPPAAFLAWQETSRAVSTRFDISVARNRDIVSEVWRWRPAATSNGAPR